MLKAFAVSFTLLLTITDMHAQGTQRLFLALGDSYTIGESVAENERWPNQLADVLTRKGVNVASPEIIATTGWRTDNLKEAIVKANLKNEYDLVSLLIGVNNQYQGKSSAQYAIEFEELLKMAITLAKGNKKNVFVVSIPDYGFTPFGEKKKEAISNQIDQFNKINKAITKKYKIDYYNITDISRQGLSNPALVATDGLHPSGKMYALWVELIARSISF